jgi:hypothetical protein
MPKNVACYATARQQLCLQGAILSKFIGRHQDKIYLEITTSKAIKKRREIKSCTLLEYMAEINLVYHVWKRIVNKFVPFCIGKRESNE